MNGAEAREVSRAAPLRQRSFVRLVDRFHAAVYDYLCWLTRDTALAADLTEETFLALWKRPPDPRRPGSIRGWLLKVALNAYRQHLRREGAEVESLTEVQDCLPDAGTEPLATLTREEMRRAVQEAVGRLPLLHREVIALHSLQGLTLREAAEVLDIPVGTAKSRLAAGFALLRRALQEWKEEEDGLR